MKKAEEKEEEASANKEAAKRVSSGFFSSEKKPEKHSHRAEKAGEESEHKAKKAKEEGSHRAKKDEEEYRHKAERESRKAEKKEKDERKHGEERKEEGRERKRPKKQKPKRGKASKEKFVELKTAEIIEAIVHLANEGHTASEIGMILRDQYGIPKVSKVVGKKVSAILEEQKLLPKIPEDLMALISKSVVLREHLASNRKDMSAKRGLMLTVSKIRALERYYKKKGKLPPQWRYTPETAALLAK